MPDTGKMKRLFERCTTNYSFSKKPTMDYPEGDLDGAAEQISLYVKLLEERQNEAHEIVERAEEKLAYVVGEARRAHKSLEGALKGANVAD